MPRLRAWCCAMLAAALVAALTPAASHAGQYTVHSCQDPSGRPAGTSDWTFAISPSGVAAHDNTCPRGGLHLALKTDVVQPPDANARMIFSAPHDTSIVSYRLWRSARVHVDTGYFFSLIERFGSDWRWAGAGCKGTTHHCSGVGDPTKPLSDANRYDGHPVTPVSAIGLYVSCGLKDSGSESCPEVRTVASEAWLHRAEIDLADDHAPAFDTPPTGALLNAGATVTGSAPVSLQATDRGGGLAQAQVEVDGRVVAETPLGGRSACHTPYTKAVPCPLQASGTVAVDTAQLPDGPHSVRVLLRDAAGNVTPWGPVSVTTANAPPDVSCIPTPAAGKDAGAKLRAGLVAPRARGRAAHRVHRSLTIRATARTRARLRGTLRGADGKPIANAAVCVAWRTDGAHGAPTPLARLRTDRAGRFSTSIPRGTSRDLWAIYRVPGGAVAAKATLRVVPKLIVRPSRRALFNGDELILGGRLASGPIPRKGVLVRAEAWRGTHWQPFGEARAKGRKGRFRISYRFTATTGVQIYALRVRVVAQAGYPYTGVASKPIKVRVTG